MAYKVKNDKIGHVTWFTNFVGQLDNAYNNWPILSIT